MSIKDKVAIIGTVNWISLGSITVEVTILDYKCSWGKDRWLVTPVAGTGETWVETLGQ